MAGVEPLGRDVAAQHVEPQRANACVGYTPLRQPGG